MKPIRMKQEMQAFTMDWMLEAQQRICRNNQILFARDSNFLSDLAALIREQPHSTVVLWALELAEETALLLYERYPEEARPKTAVSLSRDWAFDIVKMPVAQRAILQAHAMAKELTSPEDAALCHAVGQACGVVHTSGHALGYSIYELTALIRRYGLPGSKEPVEARMRHYIDRMKYWRQHAADEPREWASFLKNDRLK